MLGSNFTETPSALNSVTQPIVDEYSALQGLRVLIVDDDVDNCDLMASFFTLVGADVATAVSVAEGLSSFAARQPQLLLSDIAMPNQDGYALIQAIRALSPAQGGQVPAIALSAYADHATQQRALAAGFNRHVAKPIDPYELVEVMVRVLEAVRASGNPSEAG